MNQKWYFINEAFTQSENHNLHQLIKSDTISTDFIVNIDSFKLMNNLSELINKKKKNKIKSFFLYWYKLKIAFQGKCESIISVMNNLQLLLCYSAGEYYCEVNKITNIIIHGMLEA